MFITFTCCKIYSFQCSGAGTGGRGGGYCYFLAMSWTHSNKNQITLSQETVYLTQVWYLMIFVEEKIYNYSDTFFPIKILAKLWLGFVVYHKNLNLIVNIIIQNNIYIE